jgi:phosphoribosylamine---glycine ligase
MKVLVVGSGGREHALAWRLRQDDPAVEIFAAPGNPGIAELGRCIPVAATDVGALAALARETAVDWTLVGPEAALDAGIADVFRSGNLPIFGPSRAAAKLESSKAFAKSIMESAGVPTARALRASSLDEAACAIDELGAPVVIKASGLAAGKGVIVCDTANAARDAARSMLEDHVFGDAGEMILVEEFMEGEELSLFVLTDGERVVPLPAVQDHKRLLDGDRGPNTGGMGAYCPVSLVERSPDLVDDVVDRVARPTLAAMRARGEPFCGLLYVGLMLTSNGPKVVEFNCRFGDPETQALMPVLGDDGAFSAALSTVARGGLLDESWRPQSRGAAVTTILASAGYPDRPRAGDPITLPPAPNDVVVFHAGTERTPSGTLVTAGGRVLAVTGVGDSLDDAQRASQEFAANVEFAGKQFRTDIGWRELARRAGAA